MENIFLGAQDTFRTIVATGENAASRRLPYWHLFKESGAYAFMLCMPAKPSFVLGSKFGLVFSLCARTLGPARVTVFTQGGSVSTVVMT